MAQAMVNFRIDENLKKQMGKTCQEMGRIYHLANKG